MKPKGNKRPNQFAISAKALVFFRISSGLLAIADAVIKILNADWLYGARAYVGFPEFIYDRALWLNSLVAAVPAESWPLVLGVQFVAGVLLVFGFYPRLALLSWLVVLRMCMRRNPVAVHIGELAFSFLGYWVLFLPLKHKKSETTCNITSSSWPWSSLYFFQMAAIYFFAGLTKFLNPSWQNGSFWVRYLQLPETPAHLHWLLQYPTFLHAVAYTLPIFQMLSAAFLLGFSRSIWVRYVYVLLFAGFHLVGLYIADDFFMFAYLVVGLIPLLPIGLEVDKKSTRAPIKKILITALLCGLILVSNVVSLFGGTSALGRGAQGLLGRSFQLQGWRVFEGVGTKTQARSFYQVSTGGETKEIKIDKGLAQSKFLAVEKGASKSHYGFDRWLAGLCLDQKIEGTLAVKTSEVQISDTPPFLLQPSPENEEMFPCDELIKNAADETMPPQTAPGL